MSSAKSVKRRARSSERSKYGQLRSSVVWKPSTSEVGVAERVEVLAQGLGERGAHAVQALHRREQREIPVGDDDLLRGRREVGAQGVGVERQR